MSNAKLGDIAAKLDDLDRAALKQLSDTLYRVWGIHRPAEVVVQPVTPVEEKTGFSVFILDVGEKRINVIKEVRAQLGLPLKESKAYVDGIKDKHEVKGDLEKHDADALAKLFEDAGAKVEVS